jgi:RNA polymerase sigma factor (TIGR02999 family)
LLWFTSIGLGESQAIPRTDVTCILSGIEHGDPKASEQLLLLLYDELHELAAQKLAQEKPGQTLQATALVNEAYLRLLGTLDPGWNSRGHFFAAAAEAMRRILIERARKQRSEKHGGNLRRVDLDCVALVDPDDRAAKDFLAVNEALERLAQKDAVAAQVVKLRFFGGLTMEQVAAALGLPLRTVERNWEWARTWLHRELS